jgi:glycine reductase
MVGIRVIHVLNQFFAGLGGEERADQAPVLLPGARGPGRLLEQLAPELDIAYTLAFGDNWAASDLEANLPVLLERVEEALGDTEEALRDTDAALRDTGEDAAPILIAGPAFKAGRYGLACAALCASVHERLGIPTVTALHPENPGVDAFRKQTVIVAAGEDVMSMRETLEDVVSVARKLVRGEPLDPARDPVLRQGRRINEIAGESGAVRAVDMLLRKMRGEPFETEYAMPSFDRVPPAPALTEPERATVALVTSGGIVPRGNPDHIESANAHTFGSYSLAGLDALSSDTHQTVHGGYDPTFASADPNRVMPLDAARDLEVAGRIGRVYPRYFATVGNATSVESAQGFGREIAAQLVADGVQAVILTST